MSSRTSEENSATPSTAEESAYVMCLDNDAPQTPRPSEATNFIWETPPTDGATRVCNLWSARIVSSPIAGHGKLEGTGVRPIDTARRRSDP